MPWHDYIYLALLILAIGSAYAIFAFGIVAYMTR